ncbi:MAG TPA: ABC transporter permease [Terracidiphilus sp.]|nr:ABC transporter permease [Terracidiphilus sp.]
MKNLFRDLKLALRKLRSSPGFTVTVVLMLALGIGANTAVFSVMNAVLMQLLPVSRPEGLSYVHIGGGQGQAPGGWNTGDSDSSFTESTYEAFRQRTDVFEDLIAYVPLSFTGNVPVRFGELPEDAEGEEVSGNFFSALGARIAQGRGFSLNDETNHAPIAVLSYDYWTRRFARDPGVLGHTIYVRGIPLTIVGISAHGFKGIEPATSTDFWIPLQNRPDLNAWGTAASDETLYGAPKWWCLRMMARLRQGVSSQQASQALAGAFLADVEKTLGHIDPKQWKPLVDFVPARGIAGLNDNLREPVKILMWLVGMVLLIACTNVAMMIQARNTVRQREFSVRMAMGAARAAIFRYLLAESLLLVGAGAASGWVFALAATRALAAWSEIETGLSPDRTVLLFTLGISSLAALIFGLAPLFGAVSAPVAGVLRSNASNLTSGRSRVLGGRIVLSAQIAGSLVLLMAASLLLRTLRNYATENLGIQAESVLVFGVAPQGQADSHLFYRNLLDHIRQTPGVESVSMAGNRPGSGWSNNDSLIVDGVWENGAGLRWNSVGPDFFKTLDVPILAGRDIDQRDVNGTQRVVVVNETLVNRFLPHTNPIGHQIWKHHPATIIGVVADNKYTTVDEQPRPMAFTAAMQDDTIGTMSIEVRASGDAMALLPQMRTLIAGLYPNVPLEKPMTQKEQFERSYEQQRMFAAMGGFFGLLAALLVATGLYGMHSYRVSRRATEIGVRMALGASRTKVLAMVLRESLWVLIAGLAAGIPLTYFASRQLKSMLYQLSPFDPVSFALAIAAMLVVSAAAASVPARRAASIEPMQALRAE